MSKNKAFILAGGKSKRFGEDKTLYLLNGKSMITHCIKNVCSVSEDIYIVSKDISKYSHLKNVKVVEDMLDIQTPLSGIYTACFHAQEPFLVIGADMPFIKKEILYYLVKHHKKQATLFEIDGFFEPLLAIYSPSIKDTIKSCIDENILSVNGVLKKLDLNVLSKSLAISLDKNLSSFYNINTKEDIKKINYI